MSKQAALSPYVLQFPSSVGTRTTAAIEIFGRQKIVRFGLFFAKVGKHRRSVYQQFDGEIILADECRCEVSWGITAGFWTPEHLTAVPFSVTRSVHCPINCHMIAARQSEVA